MKNRKFVISVMSKDRPGIIADITNVIFNMNGDLADLNQSVLGGYFSMILIADFEENVTVKILESGFSKIESETSLEAIVKEIDGDHKLNETILPSETYVVTAQGVNRKGLVKVLGEFFYVRDINVLDLVTARIDEKYTMIFQVDLSHIESMKDLRGELEILGSEENLDLVLQHNDIYMATNEVGTALDTIIGN